MVFCCRTITSSCVPAGIKEAGRHKNEIRFLTDDGWMDAELRRRRELAVCCGINCTANKTVNCIADSVTLVLGYTVEASCLPIYLIWQWNTVIWP